MKPAIYFISGVSGVGKSSTMPHLRAMLPPTQFDIHDLDERGVPDGGGLDWLNSETRHWLDIAKNNATHSRSTIICGFANPELFKNLYKPHHDIPAQLILLHASESTLKDRLNGRHSSKESIHEIERMSGVTLERFIQDTVSFAKSLRILFQNANYPIIETDTKSPRQVAEEVAEIIRFSQTSTLN